MQEFWRGGYSATSMPRLETAMGINRQSLYDTFNNKRELYLQVLKYYHENVIKPNFAKIESDQSPKQGIINYFQLRAKEALTSSEIKGCLVTNSIAELAMHDKEVADQTNVTLQYMKSVFERALVRAQDLNEIKRNLDVDATANFLVNCAQGLFIMSKMSTSKTSVEGTVAQIKIILGNDKTTTIE
jgi:TetR/AcrR family transcriptional repressor of nem operon